MLRSALVAATLAAGAFAVPQITSPEAGASLPASAGSITVEWKDDGKAPKVAALKGYTIQLIVGGNTDTDSQPLTATDGSFGSATSVKLTFGAAVADEVKNGFYLKMMSTATEGGLVTTYSDRFSLAGMTGTTQKQYIDAATAAGTKVPEMVDATANNADAAAGAGDAANANSGVPFAEQTGLLRFAPMQAVPPTKITKKDTKPLYPTSSYKIAVSFLPTPSATKTQTASQTFSADSMENTASPVPGPDGDMQRFLNRWKD